MKPKTFIHGGVMSNLDMTRYDWYKVVQNYTQRLVSIRSVSPGDGENRVAQEVLRLLHQPGAGGLADIYTASGLDPIEGDPFGRQNAFAFLRGRSPHTLVLLGHIDTVDTKDYGPLEPHALDPETLALQQDTLVEITPELKADLDAHPGDWMFGRGVIDMKSGVAVNIALMRRLASEANRALSIVLLATPDEENESAGILQAVRLLLRLREQYELKYAGAINTDYTTSLYPSDPHRYVYSGTTGKLLPSFLLIGRESHVGDPFDGIDANLLAAELIRNLSMNDDLCDIVRGQITPPPVTLRASDLKTHYDVQLPFAAYFYLNVLTFTTTPGELLERLSSRAEIALKSVLQRIDSAERRWARAREDITWTERAQARQGTVLTYANLYAETAQRLGQENLAAELGAEWERWPAGLDRRERSLHLVYRLWTLSGRQGPAIIIYYSPPYYPHAAAKASALQQAVAAVVAAHPDQDLVQQEYYQFISDMSYLRLDSAEDLTALKANMPVWQEPASLTRPGGYSLPLDAIQKLGLPFVNFGPYGKGAHQRGERALMSYSFGILPQLLYETIERLALLVEEED